MTKTKKYRVALWVTVLLLLVSMIGVSAAQTGCGSIDMSEINWVSPAGYKLSAFLYVPETATAENPAPAVVAVHGWYNNKSMQDLFANELARRGYVVLSLDMQGHGDSQALAWDELYNDASGEYSAVQMIASLPFVDKDRIGLTGHSSGGDMASLAVALDNQQEEQLISAVCYQASIPLDDLGADHRGDMNDRSLAIIADQYDEFFYYGGMGLTSLAGADVAGAPRDFINTPDAQAFLNFADGGDAAPTELTPASANTMYTKDVDGKTSYRVIYTPHITHPKVAFSTEAVADLVGFFNTAMGVETSLADTDQNWQVKVVFNTLGLLSFFAFLALFPVNLLEVSTFAPLKAQEEVRPSKLRSGKEKLWFWGSLLVAAVFSGFSFAIILSKMLTKEAISSFFIQTSTLSIGVWALVCGIFALVLVAVKYYAYDKKNGISFADYGLAISGKNLLLSIALAVVTLLAAFGILFFADYFFKADFRFYVIALRAFKAPTALTILRFLVFFLAFYVVNSVTINCFNYVELGGKGWVNTLVLALFNALGVIVYNIIQYSLFFKNGVMPFRGNLGLGISGIWGYCAIFYLTMTPLVTRFIYKHTKNPYVGGIINAVVVTAMCVANTTTVLG